MEAQRARSPNHMDHIGSPSSSSSSSSSPSPRVTHAHWNPASGLRISIHACHVRLHDCRPRRRRHLAVGALQRHGLTFDFLDDNTFLILSTLCRDHRPADREVRLRPCIVAHRRRAIQRRRTERGLSLGGLGSLGFRLFLFFCRVDFAALVHELRQVRAPELRLLRGQLGTVLVRDVRDRIERSAARVHLPKCPHCPMRARMGHQRRRVCDVASWAPRIVTPVAVVAR